MLPELARGLKEKVVKYFGVENIWSNASEMIVRTRDMDVFFDFFDVLSVMVKYQMHMFSIVLQFLWHVHFGIP